MKRGDLVRHAMYGGIGVVYGPCQVEASRMIEVWVPAKTDSSTVSIWRLDCTEAITPDHLTDEECAMLMRWELSNGSS